MIKNIELDLILGQSCSIEGNSIIAKLYANEEFITGSKQTDVYYNY